MNINSVQFESTKQTGKDWPNYTTPAPELSERVYKPLPNSFYFASDCIFWDIRWDVSAILRNISDTFLSRSTYICENVGADSLVASRLVIKFLTAVEVTNTTSNSRAASVCFKLGRIISDILFYFKVFKLFT